MAINVKSESGVLKKVMLHRPGKELEQLVPGELERLLFDDIPYLKTAQQEHDRFAQTLRENGVEVVYLEDLMAETLKAHPEIRTPFIRQFIREGGKTAIQEAERLEEYLDAIRDERELVDTTMSGIHYKDIGPSGDHPLVDFIKSRYRFVLDPIPNLYFTRDPFASIGNGVSVHYMYSKTRRRETIYGDYIMNWHPDFGGKVKRYYNRDEMFSIEGGDILNLSANVLAVGISQRTTPEAIEILAKNIFRDEESEIDTVIALDIPNLRAYMHLDTVMTQVDRDKFTVFPGILPTLRIYVLTKGEHAGELHVRERTEHLEIVLAEYLNVDRVKLIYCGGKDHVAAEREQWNDGSNTLCIGPGRVIVYDRNNITNEILKREGLEVLEIASSELSRGRGGPRCMSMPLERE